MFVKQISIFVENHFGSAADVIGLLAEKNINISALSIADTADYGIMRLIVDRPEEAKAVLSEQGVTVKLTDVLALPIADRPGGLSAILQILRDGQISIDYMYAFVGRRNNAAVVVARTDDPEAALRILTERGIMPLSAENLF